MKIYKNKEGCYDTNDPCPKCGWIVDVVDWDDESFVCYCSQCKKDWVENKDKPEELYSGYLATDHEVQLVCDGDEWVVDVKKRNDDDLPDEQIEGHIFAGNEYEKAKTLYGELVNKYDNRTDLASHANAYS